VAATKKTGKTRFLLSVLYSLFYQQGVPASFISLEMKASEIFDLLIARHCLINSGKIENGNLDDVEKRIISDKISELTEKEKLIHITSPNDLTGDGLISLVRYHHRLYGSKAIGIDFLTRVNVDSRYEFAEYGKIVSRLAGLARELNVAIFLICQLNKTAEEVERPNIGMVEGTGRIAQFADCIILLVNQHRLSNAVATPETFKEQRVGFNVVQRQGGSGGWVEMIAQLQFLKFDDVF
jgi:replicative DNA helicase